jgi:hypothetical protein
MSGPEDLLFSISREMAAGTCQHLTFGRILMRWNTSTRLLRIVWAVALLLLGPARLCHGGLLNFNLDPNGPAISGFNGRLTFNTSTREFDATVVPLLYSSPTLPGGGSIRFLGGSETNVLTVNPDGSLLAGGKIQLVGTLSIDATTISGPLLTGDITAFGAGQPGSLPFTANELFRVTGGILTETIRLNGGETLPPQFRLGAAGGVIFFAERLKKGTPGDFARDFVCSNVKKIEGSVLVPESPSWVLVMIGGVVLAALGFVRNWTIPTS